MKIKNFIILRDCYRTMCDIILQENGDNYTERDLWNIKLGQVGFVLDELNSKCVICEKCGGTGTLDIEPDSVFKEGCEVYCPTCKGSGGYFREYDINTHFGDV